MKEARSAIIWFVCCLMLLVSTLLLQACSTATPSPLSKGAAEFDQQEYQAAFTDLLPLAQKGDAQAQYAVGYLYYNGLGVSRDFKLAQSWFQKAAAQGNAKAKKALSMIEEAKASETFQAPPALT